jgi:hypothetical protein
VLQAADQTGTPGLFDELASPGAIVPPERVPGRGIVGSAGGGSPADDRRNKNRRSPRPRRLLVAGAVVVAVVVAGAVALAARGGDETKTSVAVGPESTSTRASTTTAPLPFKGTFNTTYTVTAVNAGPSLGSGGAQVGKVTTSTAVVECDLVTCTFTGPSPVFDQGFLGLTFTRTGDHFDGTRVDGGGAFADTCGAIDEAVITSKIDLLRDATGKITGLTGTNQIVHPNGVESADGMCATEDITSTFVGVPA